MLDGDYTAKDRCKFCQGVMVGIVRQDDRYIVQCQDCGAVTSTYNVQKNNSKPSRMAKVRKIKSGFYDKE